ncbi:MAG TPA: hypothetical protein QGG47_12265 [Acidobacteriota bacterium]|nr:hypothetical protein [Acidobacteriota bacterium]
MSAAVRSPSAPSKLTLNTQYTGEQVKAGDFPEGATAMGECQQPDGCIHTFRVRLADLRASILEGKALSGVGYRVEPGSLHVVVQEGFERQRGRQRGGAAPKHLSALQELMGHLVAGHPDATTRELWEMIPGAEDDDADVYRDGEKVVQREVRRINTRRVEEHERSITFETFRRYVTRARQEERLHPSASVRTK